MFNEPPTKTKIESFSEKKNFCARCRCERGFTGDHCQMIIEDTVLNTGLCNKQVRYYIIISYLSSTTTLHFYASSK